MTNKPPNLFNYKQGRKIIRQAMNADQAAVIPIRRGKRRPGQKTEFTKKVEKVIKRNLELKFYTVNGTANTEVYVNSNYQVAMTDVPIVPAAAVPDDFHRIGDKIEYTSLHVRWKVNAVQDLGTTPRGLLFRVMVYQYKPNNGQLPPNLGRLLVNDYSGGPAGLSHNVIDHVKDYHVLYDKTVTLIPIYAANGTTASADSGNVRYGSFWVRLNRCVKNPQFDAAGLGHNDAIYITCFSDCTSGAGTRPIFNFQSRLRFLDG